MTIKQRVLLSVSATIVLFVALGVIFFVTGTQVRKEIRKARLSAEIGGLVSDIHVLTTDYVMQPTPQIQQEWQSKYSELVPLLTTDVLDSKAERIVLTRIRNAYDGIGANFEKLTELTEEAPTPVDTDDVDAALRRRLVGQLLVMNHAMMSGVLQVDERARERIENAHRKAEFVAMSFIVVATLLTLLIGGATMTRIVRGLQRMTAVASTVTDGDLTVDVPVPRRHDEIGALMQAFRSMAHTLRHQTAEVREGADIISTSASAISSSIAQITSSATESASAVAETSTTVEELKQTAGINNDKATEVSTLAEHAAQTSQSGKAAAVRIADEIGHIQEQMSAIGDSLLRLSEQSQNIGDIIGAVDDLSEQSNLLAVNAAIEAARAGEHGRGFTVVAEEIKSLATQSRDATQRVRTILGDVQKQTASAVMAAEQGGKAVDAAVVQEGEASEAIDTLATSIGRAAEAATQIAVSSHQQLVGVDQVGVAMENIRSASNQNATGLRQLEQSSRRLQELSQKLAELMRQYRV